MMSDGEAPTLPETPVPEGYRQRLQLLVPAREARAFRVAAREVFQVIDVRGQQVGDLMAWLPEQPDEYLSPAHTVSCLARLVPREGEELYSNHRRPLFRIRRDTVGRHDFVVPCCDQERYARDFGQPDHPSCLASIRAALVGAGETWIPHGELAWNVFMNNLIEADGRITTEAPPHGAGAYIELEALADLGVVLAACPQDLTPCNAFHPTEMAVRVYEPVP
jgi:uncharacterized protein YcgI (DUF1989 family)